ncbi:MAG TPA: lipid-binding SYLF domain-containing protein [Terriglobia bacterium]|nr:lipid-binding SYLF domain-containing protein [Terriglobia bacterium]
MKRLSKFTVGVLLPLILASLAAAASSDRTQDVERIDHATRVFHSIMRTPDHAIPSDLLSSARCIAIIPGEKQAAFLIGAKYGKGIVTCRTAHGWSAPAFLAIAGGSYGFQIGAASTDIVMIFRNRHGLADLLSDKFRVGADATAAAGPVGRHVAAATNITLHSEILTYARSRGAFAGISLNGAVVQPDDSGNAAMYGPNARTREILDGAVHAPVAARRLLVALRRYSPAPGETVASKR